MLSNYNLKTLLSSVNIDITYRCQLACPMCSRQSEAPEYSGGSHISIEDMEKIYLAFKRVSFCGNLSDPIYHPNFISLLEVGKKYNVGMNIHTTAHGKSNEWWNELISTMKGYKNITFIVGLDGMPKDSHIHRVNQDGEAVFKNMVMLREAGFKVIWQYIVFRYNENDMDKAKELSKIHDLSIDFVASGRWKFNDFETKYEHLIPTKDEWRV